MSSGCLPSSLSHRCDSLAGLLPPDLCISLQPVLGYEAPPSDAAPGLGVGKDVRAGGSGAATHGAEPRCLLRSAFPCLQTLQPKSPRGRRL